MNDYNFWQDLFDTFLSLNDWIKALIVLGFYGTITCTITASIVGSVFLLRERKVDPYVKHEDEEIGSISLYENWPKRGEQESAQYQQAPYLLTKQTKLDEKAELNQQMP